MDFNQFLHDRQPRWERLILLLDRVDSVTLSGLTAPEADELFSLYRLVSSDLNLVQTRTSNPALLEYLEKLVGRAYANLSVPRHANLLKSWWMVLRHYFPSTLRREAPLLALATLAMVSGIVLGLVTTLLNPELAELFLPPEHLTESPRQRVAILEAAEAKGESQIKTAADNTVFTTFLFTHNIRVTILCFCLGFTLGIGTVVLLFYNGALLGSIAALYYQDGVMTFFLGWIGPHGAIELPCILIGGTAGLMVARAQLRRDGGPVFAQIRAARPALVDLLVGTASLLVVAGAVEGGFSQINEPTLSYTLKIAVAAALFAILNGYLFFVRSKPRGLEPESGLVTGD